MRTEPTPAWKSLEDTVIDGDENLRLVHLESHERVPVYSGLIKGKTPVMVRFFHELEGTTTIFDRHREASFLSHPNLLRCLGTGMASLSGDRFVYGVYESPNMLLSTLLEGKTFSPEETRSLCMDILDALEYLHNRGLVYCNLDRTTVARCGDEWKLCDYSELRPEGPGYGNETRRLLGALPGAPPEAYSGVVTPAWDCWSVAHLLRNLSAEPAPARTDTNGGSRPQRPVGNLAEPFRSVAAACLLPDLGERCTTADIRRQLLAQPAQPVEPPAPAPPQPTLPQPVPPPTPLQPPEPPPVFTAPQRARPGAAAILVAAATAVALLIGVSTYLRDIRKVAAPIETPVAVPTRARTSGTARPAATEIRTVVDQWANAFRQGDLDKEMSLYATRVRRFYLKNNVSPSFVRQTKKSAFQAAGQIQRYDIENVDTRLNGADAATVTFDKTWDFAGKTRQTGKVRSELQLERRDGAWRIVSERDLKVYRQTRTRA